MVGGGGGGGAPPPTSSRTAGRNQPVADPDLQIGGRGGGHPDPEIRGKPGLKKFFFRPYGPQFGLKIRGGGGWGGGPPWAPPLDLPLET